MRENKGNSCYIRLQMQVTIKKQYLYSLTVKPTDIETEIPKFQYRPRKFFSWHGEQFGGIRDFAEKRCGECAMHITRAITLMCVAEVTAFLARLKTRSYRRKMQLTHALSEWNRIPLNCSPCREKMAANFGISPLYLWLSLSSCFRLMLI